MTLTTDQYVDSAPLPPLAPVSFLSMGGHSERILEEYENWLRSWGASQQTVTARLWCARSRLEAWGDPATVTAAQVQAWLGRGELSSWSRVTYYSHVRSWFGWLAETGRIEADPTARLRRPPTPRPRPRPLTNQEANRALAHAKGNVHSWLLLAMLAGLRAHEIAKIHGHDVTEESIFVLGKGGEMAYIPTHPALWELAQRYPPAGYWYPSWKGEHVQGRTVSDCVAKLFRSLGIAGSVHRCRHLYGSQLLRNGTNIRVVQTLLRHRDLSTTENYTEVLEDERIAAVANLTWGSPAAASAATC